MIKVFAISASEFAVPEAQPILCQLIKFALLKGTKVGVLIENDAEQTTVNEALAALQNDNEIDAKQILMLRADNQEIQSYKSELGNDSSHQLWLQGKNPELLHLLSGCCGVEGFQANDYSKLLLLTSDNHISSQAQQAGFKVCLGTPGNECFKHAAALLGGNLVLAPASTAITRDRSDTANSFYTLVPLEDGHEKTDDDDNMEVASYAGTTEIIISASKRRSVPPRPASIYANNNRASTTLSPQQASSSNSAQAANTIIYGSLGVDPTIEALAFSYQSLAQEIVRPRQGDFLPLLLIELATLLKLPVKIIKSQATTQNSILEQELRRIGINAISEGDTSTILEELLWQLDANNSSDSVTYSKANVYFVSSNQAKVNEVKASGYSAFFCQTNPHAELLAVTEALKKVLENSPVPKIQILAAKINQVMQVNNSNVVLNIDEQESEHDDNDARRPLLSRQQSNSVMRQPTATKHSAAWVAGFFATSALGGAAGAGAGQYFIPENLVSEEIRATLIATCSLAGSGLFGLSYFLAGKLYENISCCCREQNDDNAHYEPLPQNVY